MGRGSPRYTDEQRAAVSRAIVQGGMTAEQAVAAAAKGELGIDPFDMPASTARGIAGRARMEASAVGEAASPEAAAIYERGWAILECRIAALEEDPESADMVELQRIARTARELNKLGAAIRPPPHEPQPDEEPSDAESEFTRQLLAHHRATSPTGNGA